MADDYYNYIRRGLNFRWLALFFAIIPIAIASAMKILLFLACLFVKCPNFNA
ncbi:hypothetical protein IQ249_05285 [Lusitaniella coriacea LEGE 07157]|uniref:Uncharacterized protein n=1 Tax=Lusitaniella coriacea LEGE 07157 TaxID=945747 RepID=A0A8J7AP29_9CYAN|nr:hypothetical protein [Lusitaniella coriacea LEGE 07157]